MVSLKHFSLFIAALLPLLFIFSCTNKKVQAGETVVIDFDKIISDTGRVDLSDFVSSLEYVPLETNDSCLLTNFPVVQYVSSDYILVNASKNKKDIPPLLFDRQGNFIRRIGRFGQSPGELAGVPDNGYIGTNNHIYLYVNGASMSVYEYAEDGKCVRSNTLSKSSLYSEPYPSRYPPMFYFGGNGTDLAVIYTDFDSTRIYRGTSGDTLLIRYPGKYEVFATFVESKVPHDRYKYTAMYIPIIDYTRPDCFGYFDYLSQRYIRFYYDGRIEYPYEFRCSKQSPAPDPFLASKPWFLHEFYETDRYLFIGLIADQSYMICYDKKNKKSYCTTSNGFSNDVDGGLPSFWPSGVTSDGKLYMVRSVPQIKEAAIQSDNTAFRAFADRLKEEDNNVLIFAELK